MPHLESFPSLIPDIALKTTILLALGAALGGLLRPWSAATRHMARALFMAALLLLPFSAMMLPSWHVRWLPNLTQASPATALPGVAASLAAPAPRSAVPAAENHKRFVSVLPRAEMASVGSALRTRPSSDKSQVTPSKTRQTVHQFSEISLGALNPLQPPIRTQTVATRASLIDTKLAAAVQSSRLEWFAWAWLFGVMFLACRRFYNLIRLRRLVHGATPVQDPQWNYLMHQTLELLTVKQRVGLVSSAETDVPLAAGILRPVVVLPPDHPEWPVARRRTILLHEISHIRRRDALAQMLAHLVTVMYWFHPLAWWMERAMRIERERACDDQVLAAGTKASEYAHELLTIVSQLRRPHLAAALGMARRSQLEGRVLAILNPKLQRGSVSGKATMAFAALVFGLALPLAAARPPQQPAAPKIKSSAPKPSPAVPATPGPDMEQTSEAPRTEVPALEETPQPDVSGLLELQDRLAEMQAEMEAGEFGEKQPLTLDLNLQQFEDQLGRMQEQIKSQPSPPPNSEEREAELRALLRDAEALRTLRTRQSSDRQAENLADAESRVAELRAMLAATEEARQSQAPAPPAPPESPSVPAAPASPSLPAAPAAPAPPAAPAAPAPPAAPQGDLNICGGKKAHLHQMNMESHDGYRRWTATWSGDDCSVELRSEGDIRFNAEATAIQSISDGGYFEVNMREGATLKQVRVTPSGNSLNYVYKINGSQQPFEGEAKTWFSNFLLSLERSTGLASETRVPALLAKGGPGAVLDEINTLQGDYVRGIYFRKLLQNEPNLPPAMVVRVINQAGQQIASDYEMARVLMEVSRQYPLKDETSRAAFLKASDRLKSDYEHSRVLIEFLRRPDISSENVRMALNSAASIKSDYEKSRILLALVEQNSFQASYLDAYLTLASSIHSDYEKSRDLLAPLKRYTLTAEAANQILSAAQPMTSDYEKSRLLTGLAAKEKFDEKEMSSYLTLVDSLKSDYERSRSLMALLQNNELSSDSVKKALTATAQAHNDYEKSRVLTSLVGYRFDESQMGSYLAVVDSMTSDYERSRSLMALLEHHKLSDAALGKVIESVPHFKNDYEKSRVLQAISQRYTLQGALRESFIKAAETINGEYERGRALAGVVRRATL